MSEYESMKCVACSGDAVPFGEERIAEIKKNLPEWEVVAVEGEERLIMASKTDALYESSGS